MKNWSSLKYLLLRILILLVGGFISSIIGLSSLDRDRRCGTGDGLAIAGFILIFYGIWTLGLFIEAFVLHRKKDLKLRNLNLTMALVLPTLLFPIYLYFEIMDFID